MREWRGEEKIAPNLQNEDKGGQQQQQQASKQQREKLKSEK